MKIILFSLLSFAFFSIGSLFVLGEEDKFAKLDITNGNLSIKKQSDQWLRITVPFKLVSHPRIEALEGRRPLTLSQAFNPKFIDDIKVKLWICFANKFKQNLLRSTSNLKDSDFYQYYDAEIEYLTLDFDRSTKNAIFLFPTTIAERDGFLGANVKPVGYVVEISHADSNFKLSNAVYFNYRGATEEILESFKSQALSESPENKGVLVPAHKIDASYLVGMGPVKTADER
ncbi:MAG: hypothetical protein P8N49_03720 [Opitutales bacterium]|nr:hypothetical protein [Opitutales bacterium]